MARCEVVLNHSRIRKNTFLDDAKDEADAIRQFKETFRLPPLPKDGSLTAWPIEVKWFGQPPQPQKEPKSESLPKSAAEAIAAEVAPPVPGVDVLRPFGVTPGMATALQTAGLTTVPKILAHVKKHGGLNVPGIDAAAIQTIKNAIKSFQSEDNED